MTRVLKNTEINDYLIHKINNHKKIEEISIRKEKL